jgi:hypothetical protein
MNGDGEVGERKENINNNSSPLRNDGRTEKTKVSRDAAERLGERYRFMRVAEGWCI